MGGRYRGLLYRAHNPRRAYAPGSGEGVAVAVLALPTADPGCRWELAVGADGLPMPDDPSHLRASM